MRVALRGSYVDFVMYMGITEKYPLWFERELNSIVDYGDSQYTFYVPLNERRIDYYEKQIISDYSVFIRKANGEVHVTDNCTFHDMYSTFIYNEFTHSGIAAFDDDCIDYVECQAGVLPTNYPEWFYEFFTEAFNFPKDGETIYFFDETNSLSAMRGDITVQSGGEASIREHTVFLRNRFGEIKAMPYDKFVQYYDPSPKERWR